MKTTAKRFIGKVLPDGHLSLLDDTAKEVGIRTLEVIRGSFPRRALLLVKEWATLHKKELMEDWRLCETRQSPHKIPPLE